MYSIRDTKGSNALCMRHYGGRGTRYCPEINGVKVRCITIYAIPHLKLGMAALVRPAGLEPALFGLKGRCATLTLRTL